MNIQKRALLFVLLMGAATYAIIAAIVFQSWDRYLVPKVAKVRTLTITGKNHIDDLQERADNGEEFANGTNRAEVVFGTNVTDTKEAPWKQNG